LLGAYSATKFAVHGLTQAASRELAQSFVSPELKRLEKNPDIRIITHEDSGLSILELYKLCEELGMEFDNEIRSEDDIIWLYSY